MSITFGADPEFFICREGAVIPAVGLVGGTKEQPRMVDVFGLQEDNVMAEFTIPPTPDAFMMPMIAVDGARIALREIRNHVPDAEIWRSPVALFPNEVLLAAGDAAAQFGCSPDFDAYEMGAKCPLIDPKKLDSGGSAWRFAGGHVHIGYKEQCPEMPEYVAALFCDATIGLALAMHNDVQGERRKLYGQPGRFRPTPYGLEYRTPSNFWLYSKHVQLGLTQGMDNLRRLLMMGSETHVRAFNETPWNDVKAAISNEDGNLANALANWFSRTYFDNNERNL